MSLLWRTAIVQTASFTPEDYEDHEDISGLVGERRSRHQLSEHHINRLADSIRQHGYDPERHGMIGVNLTDHGDNAYLHSRGTEGDPEDHEHHEHLLHALHDTGHTTVPVHFHDQSSTGSANEAPKLYHGTTVEDLEEVKPNHGTRGMHGNNGMIHEPGYAYATDRDSAESYADSVAMTHGGRPRVYQVSPLGPIEKDPTYDAHGNHRANYAADVRSKHGFQVVGEEDLGHDDDYEDEWGEHHDEDED